MNNVINRFKKKLGAVSMASMMAALVIATANDLPVHTASAAEVGKTELNASARVSTKVSFRETIARNKTAKLCSLDGSMTPGNQLFIYIASFTGSGTLTLSIAESKTSTAVQAVTISGAGTKYLTVPSNAANYSLYATYITGSEEVTIGGYIQGL